MQTSARGVQLGVFKRCIVSTQDSEGIHHWTKEGRLNRKNKLCQSFYAVMDIVSELIVRGSRWETRTTILYRQHHQLIAKMFPQPDAALKERLTTWGPGEQVKQMAVVQEYHVGQCRIQDLVQPLRIHDAYPDNKSVVDQLLEMDPSSIANKPAPSVMFFKVSKLNGTHLHFVHLTNPGEVAVEGDGRMITLNQDVLCTCGFNVILGLRCRH